MPTECPQVKSGSLGGIGSLGGVGGFGYSGIDTVGGLGGFGGGRRHGHRHGGYGLMGGVDGPGLIGGFHGQHGKFSFVENIFSQRSKEVFVLMWFVVHSTRQNLSLKS